MGIPVAKPFLTRAEADSAYQAVLSGWVSQGPKVQEFEEKFAAYVGAKYAVAVSNCTAALHLAMVVAGIKPGDEVICPSFSFIATANSIVYAGAKPVFVDIDPRTYNIDCECARKAITARTKAILIVHQMGMPADIGSFKKLCGKHGLILIEDAACAIGSVYKGKRIGSHSDLVCFSFHPRKIITTGEGGMVTTSNRRHYERLKLLRHQGMSVSDRARHLAKKIIFEKYLEIGFNYRLTDIQAAIGIAQLRKLEGIIAERRKIAAVYSRAFKDITCLQIPQEDKHCVSNYQTYMLYLKAGAPVSRNRLMRVLRDEGIATRRGIMTAHRERAYANWRGKSKLPLSEDISDRSIILPLYVPMREKDIGKVVRAVIKNLTR